MQDDALGTIRAEVGSDMEPVAQDVGRIKAAVEKHQPGWLKG